MLGHHALLHATISMGNFPQRVYAPEMPAREGRWLPWLVLALVLVSLAVASVVRGSSFHRNHVRGHQRAPSAEPITGVQANQDVQDTFGHIYESHLWSDGNGGSGPGSGLNVTQYAMSSIRTVVNRFEIRSLADVPCGGMHWMPYLLRDLRDDVQDFRYYGLDIVRSVIEASQIRFANESWMHFEVFDFTRAPVPAGVELVMCRDALQHLPLAMVVDALEMFSKSEARFLLVGSYLGPVAENRAIVTGDYYSINLTLDPFLLTGYQHMYHEHTSEFIVEADKHLLLFPIAYLQSVDYKAMRERASLLV
ncbi:hypothetical protein ABBQ38_000752 [Trebouxia sp. C0009 RCD-2024]